MPNRRRSKASSAMSAIAAVAVASPIAGIAVTQLSGTDEPQHREFVQAAMVTDLPSELLGALSQGLSQFGINLPTGDAAGAPPSTPVGRLIPNCDRPCDSAPSSSLGRSVTMAAWTNSRC